MKEGWGGTQRALALLPALFPLALSTMRRQVLPSPTPYAGTAPPGSHFQSTRGALRRLPLAPDERGGSAAATTTTSSCCGCWGLFAAATAVAVIVLNCEGGAPLLLQLMRLSLPHFVAWGPAAASSAAAAAAAAADTAAGLPPPWGTRPAVTGGDTRCYLVGPVMESAEGPIRAPRYTSPLGTVQRLWGNNSRAYCVTGPLCIAHKPTTKAAASVAAASVAAALTLFSASFSCHSVDAAGRPVRPARRGPPAGPASSLSNIGDSGTGGGRGNSSEHGWGWMDPLADDAGCAVFRSRHVWHKYLGKDGDVSAVPDAARWPTVLSSTARSSLWVNASSPFLLPARWHDGLTILAPAYVHADTNLYHWLRGWTMVTHALHHLAQYVHIETAAAAAAAASVRLVAVAAGATPWNGAERASSSIEDPVSAIADDSRPFPAAAVYFFGHAVLSSAWKDGVLRASLAAAAAGGGPRRVVVANEHPAQEGGLECFRRAVLPGDDSALSDAHTYVSDAPVYSAAVAAADTHVPAVPREALALREAVYAAAGAHPAVHPADTLRLHPPAVGIMSAAAAAGLPAWPAAWGPASSSAPPPLPAESPWPSSRTKPPHPWAIVEALFASAARPFPDISNVPAVAPAEEADSLRLALPPRSILVLSRAADSKRRLDDDSAQAFNAIIRDLARTRRLSLMTVAFDSLGSLEEQVGVARRAGLVVGVHGANLVNSVFVPAGGALLELLPHAYRWPGWYEAGGNAGLRYSAVSTSPTEKWALPCIAQKRRCNDNDVRDKTLVLDSAALRTLQAQLTRAVDYLDALRAVCPDGWMTLRGDGAVYRLPDLDDLERIQEEE